MSKLEDYEFKGVGQQIVDFKDDVRDLLNSGKYQASVATTGIPGWSANTGEFAFYSSGSDRRLYLRAATSWQLIAGFNPTLNPSALGTVNAGTGNTFALIDHIHTAPVVADFAFTGNSNLTPTTTEQSVLTIVPVTATGYFEFIITSDDPGVLRNLTLQVKDGSDVAKSMVGWYHLGTAQPTIVNGTSIAFDQNLGIAGIIVRVACDGTGTWKLRASVDTGNGGQIRATASWIGDSA